jgi:hypothetical protein
VFVKLVGELAVVTGFGDIVTRRRIRGEQGPSGLISGAEEKDDGFC